MTEPFHARGLVLPAPVPNSIALKVDQSRLAAETRRRLHESRETLAASAKALEALARLRTLLVGVSLALPRSKSPHHRGRSASG